MPATGAASGPPLLFVHGSYHGAWCWQEHFMPFFARAGFDTFAVSLRDHGGSVATADPESARLADYVEDAKWAAGEIGRRPVLVGHSLGGSVVEKMAETDAYPGMVLLAPSPIGGSNQAGLRMLARHPIAMARSLRRRNLADAFPAFLESFFSPAMSPVEVRKYAMKLTGRTSFQAVEDAFFKDSPKPRKSETPVLVVAGLRDWSIPMAKNAALAAAWGGELRAVPCAHDLMLDLEWERAAEAVLDWLRMTVAAH
jgi:pimeloyl-ACP methyl ester carboxylesterase